MKVKHANPNPPPIIKALREERFRQGFSQPAFAEKLGWAQSTLSCFENGRKDPRLSTIMAYARGLGLTLTVKPTNH